MMVPDFGRGWCWILRRERLRRGWRGLLERWFGRIGDRVGWMRHRSGSRSRLKLRKMLER
jgi:hypothetical protein